MGRVTKASASAGSNRGQQQQSTQQQQSHFQATAAASLGQPMPSLFPDDLSALLRKASAGERDVVVVMSLRQREREEK